MSSREDLHHADVGGADETITVGAYRYPYAIGHGEDTATVTSVPTITLWAGFATSECGCNVDREPAEVKLPHYPRLLANLLGALGEASRAGGGAVDLDLMNDAELDTYLDDTAAAMGAATDEVIRLGVLHSAAAVAKERREKAQAATTGSRRHGTFAAPSGYESCHSNVCTNDTEAVARAAIEAAGVPALLAERQKVRELHAPVVHSTPLAHYVWCGQCGDEMTVDWPCGTARVVYTAGEIEAVLQPGEEGGSGR